MRRMLWVTGLLAAAAGCRSAAVTPVEQPLVVRGATFEQVYQATRATLAEEFDIYTAHQPSGDIRTRFRVTYGYFEPWRDLAQTRRDRAENTVQTIRRRASAEVVRLEPDIIGVRLAVEKERRDRAREGAAFSFAQAASIFDPEVNLLDRGLRDPTAPEWQPLGRDRALEAVLLERLCDRVARITHWTVVPRVRPAATAD